MKVTFPWWDNYKILFLMGQSFNIFKFHIVCSQLCLIMFSKISASQDIAFLYFKFPFFPFVFRSLFYISPFLIFFIIFRFSALKFSASSVYSFVMLFYHFALTLWLFFSSVSSENKMFPNHFLLFTAIWELLSLIRKVNLLRAVVITNLLGLLLTPNFKLSCSLSFRIFPTRNIT